MKHIVIDGNKIETREKLHNLLKVEFELPSYYGNNLDAFWDIMTEQPQLIKITVKNPEYIIMKLGDYGACFLDLLMDLRKENSDFEIILV